ncbi:MAG: nucleotidyltransferase family protein [Gammaproteobacteria bacterium]|nr:nucleotidyltransferase family protein [Gammaproteobacteria bacterium]MDH5801456.1 nucleotidyltransferase family protein [Gammaproteobacteria bacterium]
MSHTTAVAAVLLASGFSRRFGACKLMYPFKDENGETQTMVERCAKHLFAAVPDAVVVVRDDDTAVQAVLQKNRYPWVSNPMASEGMSAAIRCGIEYFVDASGWVLALGDMPYIPAGVYGQVAEALRDGAAIAQPQYHGQGGHPVGFSRIYQQALLQLQGDVGGREILRAHKKRIRCINVDSPGILQDVDSPNQL